MNLYLIKWGICSKILMYMNSKLDYVNNSLEWRFFMDKKVLFNLGYGLYVLTANWSGKDNGCIVNTVMQVADKPTTLMVSVNKNNYTNEMINETLKFNISIISDMLCVN